MQSYPLILKPLQEHCWKACNRHYTEGTPCSSSLWIRKNACHMEGYKMTTTSGVHVLHLPQKILLPWAGLGNQVMAKYKQTFLSKCYTFTKESLGSSHKLGGRFLFNSKNLDWKMQSSNINQMCEGLISTHLKYIRGSLHWQSLVYASKVYFN